MNSSFKKLFLVSAVLISTSARAQTTTHYQEMMTLFDNGTKASPADLETAYSGRCYEEAKFENVQVVTNGNTPLGGILVGKRLPNTGAPATSSPTLSTDLTKLVVVIGLEAQSESNQDHFSFDDMTQSDAYQGAFAPWKPGLNPISDDGHDLSWSSSVPFDTYYVHSNQKEVYTARKVGNSIVTRETYDHWSINGWTTETTGTVYCLFQHKLPGQPDDSVVAGNLKLKRGTESIQDLQNKLAALIGPSIASSIRDGTLNCDGPKLSAARQIKEELQSVADTYTDSWVGVDTKENLPVLVLKSTPKEDYPAGNNFSIAIWFSTDGKRIAAVSGGTAPYSCSFFKRH